MRGGTVDVGVFVETETEDGIGGGGCDAICRVGGLLEVSGGVQGMEIGLRADLAW